jgi:hypothetical protein
MEDSPKVILLDTSNGIHRPNLCPCTDQLHPNVRSHLNDRVLIIRELGGCRIWVEFDVRRDELLKYELLPFNKDRLDLRVRKQKAAEAQHQQRSQLD